MSIRPRPWHPPGKTPMPVTGTLAAFALKHTFDLSADTLLDWLGNRFTDHSQTLPRALGRANDRAWQAVGLALAGDGLIDRVKDLFRDRDLTAAREAIREFLANTPTGLEMSAAGLRVRACDELNRLRRLGRLAAPRDRAAIAGDFTRFGHTGRLAAEAVEAVGAIADALAADAPHLAEVLRLAPAGSPPLLVTAFLFFLRREVTTTPGLSEELTFDSLRHLTAAQDRGFALLDGRTERILDQIGLLFDLLGDWFTTADGKLDDVRAKLDKLLAERHVATGTTEPLRVTVTNEKERDLLRRWLGELHQLPPELLASADWTKLGDALAAGRLLAEAREAHEMAASNAKAAQNRAAEAEAAYKAYRVACEQELWADALTRLVRAVELDAARFAPFPFNRYEPVRIVGTGGFGTVMLCRERLKKGREVAVKALHVTDLGRDLEELFGEAHTVSELDDPAIIKVIHWEFADPAETRPYLVMEYFPGVSLATRLKLHGTLPVLDFIAVARNVAEGMTAAHGAGVLHRDLKPGNILVRRDGPGRWDVRVIDFGLAVRFSTVQASVSTSLPHRTRRDQSFAGTMEYASPEQKGVVASPVGPRSDVYSFGKTMLEALLGTTEPTTRTWKQLDDEYREPIREFLERCVEKNPTDRHGGFESITEALTALDPSGREPRERIEARRQKQAEEAEWARVTAETARKAAEGRERAEAERLRQETERLQREREDRERAELMESWKRTGMPRSWVLMHLDGWGPEDWTALVSGLKLTPYWPLKEDELGSYLETLQDELRAERDRQREAERRQEAERKRQEWERKRQEEEARQKGPKPGKMASREWERKRQEEEAQQNAAEEAIRNDPLHPARSRSAGDKVTIMLPGDVPMAFAWCPPGTFMMGSNHKEGQAAEKPVHRVTLTKGFYTGIHPVTQAQWNAITGVTPSSFKGDNRPVENVSWDDCQEFCQKLTAHLKGRVTVRLPSEAEWEYACRAGTTTEFHFGDVITPDLANYDGNYTWNGSPKGKYRKETTGVSSFKANPWGLFDMHGNVWEWCQDYYGLYAAGDQADPVQLAKSSDEYRVLRGGGWNFNPDTCRGAYRFRGGHGYRLHNIGCRVCFRLD